MAGPDLWVIVTIIIAVILTFGIAMMHRSSRTVSALVATAGGFAAFLFGAPLWAAIAIAFGLSAVAESTRRRAEGQRS